MGIIALAAFFRIWHITWGLPQIYEEAMPLTISWKFWNWGHDGLDFHPHFFVYPGFTFYLQFAIQSFHYLIGHIWGTYPDLMAFQQAYSSDPTAFVVIARMTSVVFDIGTLVVMYLLGSRLAGTTVGLVGALLVAINPLHIKEAHLINVDTPLTFFAVVTVLFAYRLYLEPAKKWYVWAGIAIGLAAAAKYNGAIVIGVVVLAHMLRAHSLSQSIRSLRDVRLLIAIFISGIVFIVCNPYIILRFDDFLFQFSNVQLHMQSGALGLDPETMTGEYYLFQSIPENIGWPLTVVTIVSSIYMLLSRQKENWILIAFPIVFISVIATWAMRAERYILPAVPGLIMVAAYGIFKLLNIISQRIKGQAAQKLSGMRGFQIGIGVVVGVVFVASPLISVLGYHRSVGLPDTRTAVKEWLSRNLAPGSAVATGPFGVAVEKSTFAILPIPFNAGNTERTIPYYDTEWYKDLDIVITSDYDYGRYKLEPERTHEILQFYDSVRLRWPLMYEIGPSDTYSGPAFWLYQPPKSSALSFESEKIRRLERIGDSSEVINFLGRLGLILSAKGKLQRSEQLLREVLEIDPVNLRGRKELVSIEVQQERYQEALPDIEEYLRLNPRDVQVIAWAGNALLNLGRLDESESRLKEALELDNHQGVAYLDLSILYAMRNEKQKMIDILSQYLSVLPPGSKEAALVRERLTKLRAPATAG